MTSPDSEGSSGRPDPEPGLPPTHQYYGQDPYGQPPAPPPYVQPQPPVHAQQPYYPSYAPVAPPVHGMAIASLVVGVASLLLSCAYGVSLVGSPVALVLGRVSMKRIERSEGALGGRGLALAGFILGIIGTILLVLLIALVVFLVIIANNEGFKTNSTYNS